jgi:hypothetical protein
MSRKPQLPVPRRRRRRDEGVWAQLEPAWLAQLRRKEEAARCCPHSEIAVSLLADSLLTLAANLVETAERLREFRRIP